MTQAKNVARRQGSVDPRAVRTREALVSATIELLATKRVDQLSVSGIVKAAQVSRQVFYEHFQDRDSVVLAAGGAVLAPAYEEFAANFVDDESYPEQVRQLARAIEPYRPMVCHLIDSPVHAKLNQVLCALLFTPIRDGLREMLDEQGKKASGQLLDDAAVFMIAGTQNLFIRAYRDQLGAEATAERIEQLRLLLGGF